MSLLHAKTASEGVPLNRRSTTPWSCAPTVGLQRRTQQSNKLSPLRAIPLTCVTL